MTISRYAVVRYVPDPLREEYINIGVIVVTDHGHFSGSRFLDRWSRVQRIAGVDTSFLKDIALDLSRLADRQASLSPDQPFTSERLSHLAAEWQNTVQFSDARASVAPDPAWLLDDLFRRYVGTGN